MKDGRFKGDFNVPASTFRVREQHIQFTVPSNQIDPEVDVVVVSIVSESTGRARRIRFSPQDLGVLADWERDLLGK